MSYGVDHRSSSYPALLWMRHRPAAVALIWLLSWKLQYATGAALKRKNLKNKKNLILGGGSNKMFLWFMSKSILPMFSSRCFTISGLIFRSLIHFVFIFGYGIRVLISFFYMQLSSFSTITFWRDFLPQYVLVPFDIYEFAIGAYLWAFYPVPLIHISVFIPVIYCLFYFKLIFITFDLHCGTN